MTRRLALAVAEYLAWWGLNYGPGLALVGTAWVFIVVASLVWPGARAEDPPAAAPKVVAPSPQSPADIAFAPGPDPERLLVREIDAVPAGGWIRCQYYGFTDATVAEALVRAKARGVDVAVILDRSDRTARGCQAPKLAAAGCWLRFDEAHPISHTKMCLTQTAGVIGSYNPTHQGMLNAEVEYVVRRPEYLAALGQQWSVHAAHSRP